MKYHNSMGKNATTFALVHSLVLVMNVITFSTEYYHYLLKNYDTDSVNQNI